MPILIGVRERRRRTGVKSGRFSQLCDLTRSAYISVENGNRPASHEAACRIARALTDLGIPTDAGELLGRVPDEPPEQPKNEPRRPPSRKDNEGEKDRPKRGAA